jgi:dienelactone hydrolase
MPTELHYSLDGQAYTGILATPPGASGPRPTIALFPNLMGPNAYWASVAEDLADWGYTTCIVDMYGSQVRPGTHPEAKAIINPLKADRAEVRRRLEAALSALRPHESVDPQKLIALGFCFGGMCALEAGRMGQTFAGIVSVHGTLDTPEPEATAGKLRCPVLALHGADDPAVPDEQVAGFIAEMRAAGADWQLVHFGGAVHAFTDPNANRPGEAEFHPLVNARAWKMMRQFFEERLASGEPAPASV